MRKIVQVFIIVCLIVQVLGLNPGAAFAAEQGGKSVAASKAADNYGSYKRQQSNPFAKMQDRQKKSKSKGLEKTGQKKQQSLYSNPFFSLYHDVHQSKKNFSGKQPKNSTITDMKNVPGDLPDMTIPLQETTGLTVQGLAPEAVEPQVAETAVQATGLQVSVDKTIIQPGVTSTVTVTVVQDGQPLADADVSLVMDNTVYSGGRTDSGGKFTTDICPPYGGGFLVRVNGEDFWSLLYALWDGQGVIEVTANDIDGNSMSEFSIDGFSSNWSGSFVAQQGAVRLVLPAGGCTLDLTSPYTGGAGYYLLQNAAVASQEIKKIHIDTRLNTVLADLGFSYNENAVGSGEVFLERTDTGRSDMERHVGTVGSDGRMEVYVTPGTYKASIYRDSLTEQSLYLAGDEMNIISDTVKDFSWNNENAGVFQLNLSDPLHSITREGISINGRGFELTGNRQVVFSTGACKINFLWFNDSTSEGDAYYQFSRPWQQEECISIGAGETFQYNFDMEVSERQLYLNAENARQWGGVGIESRLVNKDGYVLRDLYPARDMQIAITRPDGVQDNVTATFPGIWWTLDAQAPAGTYTVKTSGDLGTRYGSFNLSSTFKVAGEPEVSVDKTIIKPGEDTEVTITIASGGIPFANEPVTLVAPDGTNISGVTDANGQYRTVLHSQFMEEFSIQACGQTYRGLLYALDPEYGVVVVMAKGQLGNDLENFSVSLRNPQTWQGGSAYNGNKKVRLIAWQGENQLLLNTWNQSGGNYIATRTITVQPGIINPVEVNAGAEAETNLDLSYDGVPLKNMQVFVERTDSGFEGMNSSAGTSDSAGRLRMYVTPGTYRVAVQGYNANNEYMYMMKENQQLGTNPGDTCSYAWNSRNTGKMRLKTNAPLSPSTSEWFSGNGFCFSLAQNQEVILEAGNYPIGWITINGELASGQWAEYAYYPTDIEGNSVSIIPGQVSEYNLDIGIKDISLNMDKEVSPGDTANFYVGVLTQSGHVLYGCTNNSVNVSVQKPNGESISFSSPSLYGNSIPINENDPTGTYTVNAAVDLGPWYGTRNVSGTIEVKGWLNVAVDRSIINVGETSTVTVTLSKCGKPAAGEPVALKLGGEVLAQGISDDQGRFTADITPVSGGEITITAGGRDYSGPLFAAWPIEGLVEVTASDRNVNAMAGYWIIVSEGEYYNGSYAQGATGWVLADQGQGVIRVVLPEQEGNDAYYMEVPVTVTAGQVSRVHCDGSGTVSANMHFTYKGSPIVNGDVILEKTDNGNRDSGQTIGVTDSLGECLVNATPGTYRIGVRLDNKDGDFLYLTKENVRITSDSSVELSWDEKDTGRMRIKLDDPLHIVDTLGIGIDGWPQHLSAGRDIVMSAGSHAFKWMWVNDNVNGVAAAYGYSVPEDRQTVVIRPYATTIYNFSMALKDVDLKVDTENLQSHAYVGLAIEAVTQTGQVLESVGGSGLMDVTVVRPDRQKVNLQQDFRYGYYALGADAPEGTYTVYAKMDMGPRYGYRSVFNTFRYNALPYVVSADPGEGSENVALDAKITLTFSEGIQLDSKDGKKCGLQLTLKKANGGNVPFDYSIKGNILTITPRPDLHENTAYTLSIPKDLIIDKDGDSMAQDFVLNFKTGAKAKGGKGDGKK